MEFLLNIIFGILAGLLALWLLQELGLQRKIAVVLSVLIGIVVFMLDLAARVS